METRVNDLARGRKLGLLTEQQVRVLKLRSMGLSLRRIAEIMGTSHQNIAIIEKRALRRVRQAIETIIVYKLVSSPIRIVVGRGTRLVDIPRIIVDEADKKGVHVRADFTLIYKMLRYHAPDCISGQRLEKPVVIVIDENGVLNIYRYEDVRHIMDGLERL